MVTTSQDDLFASAERREAASDAPCPDRVRGKLAVILAAMRGAAAWPFPPERQRVYAVTVPQMCNWLPEDEAAAVCAEFAALTARLDAAGGRADAASQVA